MKTQKNKLMILNFLVVVLLAWQYSAIVTAVEMPEEKEFTNSIGMKFVRIEAGTFRMGQIDETLPWEILPNNSGRGDRIDYLVEGDFDERPVHSELEAHAHPPCDAHAAWPFHFPSNPLPCSPYHIGVA